MSVNEALAQLQTSENGLSEQEALRRISMYGYNEVKERKENHFLKFMKKFWAPVPWMLEITVVVTYLLGKFNDMYIILFLLMFNAVVSYVQESRAENAVAILKSKLSVKTRVLRDGQWKLIQAREIVPGDIIHVRLGDIIPADAKLIKGEIEVDQSALTGESLSVEKGVSEIVYSGSIVKRGEADCLVISTGANTYFGRTTELVQSAGAHSHIESLIFGIVKYLIILDVGLVGIMTGYSILKGIAISQILPFSLVVLIASIPVALPATFTIAMAIGALDMSKKGAIISRLNAIEDAASMDVLCMDKTGTITENKLYVASTLVYKGSENQLISYAALASEEGSQDPIDLAIINYAREKGIVIDYSIREKFTPFDPAIKRTEALIKVNGDEIRIAKGAPQIIAQICQRRYDEIMKDVDTFALRGFRVIAVASGSSKMEILGLIALYDRPRKDSKVLIEELKKLSVEPKIITGDNSSIAKEIAKEVGINGNSCRISDIKEGKTTIEQCSVLAEVFPEDKYLIVKELQKSGHITGMTGDGVNDAPALKQAEVGIAVSNATDVARASASIVLTHEGLSDIVEAVKNGRKIYQRMLTYTLNKIMKTMQVVLFLTLSFLVVRYFVTTPFDVILLLFANDFVTMSIATDNVRYSMKPERWDVKKLMISSGSLASLLVIEGFFGLWIAEMLGLSIPQIHTFVLDLLVFSGLFTVFMIRERKRFWHSMPSKWLLMSIIGDILVISLLSILGILVVRIPYYAVGVALGFTFLWMLMMDLVKNEVFRRYG
ncbi:plasma-membrane proton-efflux P-type ATPase [Sulfolobales archaeon HS-7]|nr:plasma-membrane proton-efflux P-type ATPase [Sulfolobales archaeon HS-7]